MDNNHGRSNLKKYRTYKVAESSSNASMLSSGSRPPTTVHAAATPAPQTPRDPTLGVLSRSKPAPKPRPPAPAPPTSTQPQTKVSTQSSTLFTNSRNNVPIKLPTTYRPAPVPSTPFSSIPFSSTPFSSTPFSSTLGLRDTQSPMLSSEQSSLQRISPLLTVMQDQLSSILTQHANSDRLLRDLTAEVGRLSENAKEKEEQREAKEKAREEREKGGLKALGLLAQKIDDVRKHVIGIESVVGVSKGQDGGRTTMLDRLQSIEMDVEEWLERLRDPDAAAIALDQCGSIPPPTPSSLSPVVPAVVRHEMAVSPIKVSFTSQAVSTRTPEPSSTPKSTKVDVSTQADTSDEPSTQQSIFPKVTESSSLCVSCSKTVLHSMNDIEMSDSTASVQSPSKGTKGKEVERISLQDVPHSHQIINDGSFVSQPKFSPPSLAGIAPVTQMATSTPARTEATCKRSDRNDESPSKSPLPKGAIGSFSPAEWSKTPASSSSVEGSSRGTAVHSTTTPSRKKSYTLPPLPEGTIAALRKEFLLNPYPYPLEAAGLGDVVPTMAGVVGASIEAAERMPSPESQSGGDNDDNPGEQSTPKARDTQPSESSQSTLLSTAAGLPTSQSNVTLHAAKSTESTPIQLLTRPMLRKSVSTSTESSLTSLSSDSSSAEDSITSNKSSALTKTPLPDQAQTSAVKLQVTSLPVLPIHPASQTSNVTEDENTVVTLVMDGPASPATPTLSQVLLSASPVVLISPEPSRPIKLGHSPESNDLGNAGMVKLQEWYREQRVKILGKQGNTTAAGPEDHSTKQKGASIDDLPNPPSPLFTSPNVTPPKRDILRPEPAPYLKKLVENLDDDDVEIVPSKRNSTPTTTTGSARPKVGSEKVKEKPIPSPKTSLVTTQKKKQPSKAKTRIKKRKISQEPAKVEIDSEDEEEQPPLKRVKLRLNKAPTSKAPSAKPKSVTIVSPVKTPGRRLRDIQPRTASVVWPKIDDPVFDEFIECDSCERWYHVGCVGLPPDDIRLSATEIYWCPPCDSGVPKEGELLISKLQHQPLLMHKLLPLALTPVKNTQGNKEDAPCARPKCLCLRKSQNIKKETTFVVENFVGMRKRFVGGRGLKLVYLVKWLGYDIEEATWEEEAAMGLPNPGYFVEKFEEDALREGIDLSQYNSQAVLLKCAIKAGWNSDGLFIKKEA